jgi:hypothetical protein
VRRLKPEAIFITVNPYVSTTPAMLEEMRLAMPDKPDNRKLTRF